MSTATELPDAFAAGTTVIYQRTFSDYPANAGWAATLYLAGANLASAVGAATGAAFLFTLTAAQTAVLTPGNYTWREIVSKGSEKYAPNSGVLRVTANIESALAGDMQSWEEQELARVEAILEGRMAKGLDSYQIAGRQAVLIPHKELRAYRASLKRAIWAQQHPGQLSPQVRVSFTGAGNER